MKKKLSPTIALLTALFILIVLFGTTPADADVVAYYDGFYACDAAYYPNLQNCRASGSYPDNPTESQCRVTAGQIWAGCLSALYQASPEEPDFCVNARLARDHCYGLYGPNGADPDMWAFMVCYNGTGIEHCE